MKLPSRHWQDLTTADFGAIDAARVVALLPVAAVEQHGPHLPLWTDACICEAIVERALALVPDELPVLALPMLPVGLSLEHADYPGTLTLSAETLIRVLVELGESVAAAGVRKLALVNSHGGQPQALDLAAQKLRAAQGMMVFRINLYRAFRDTTVFPEAEVRTGIHGGAIETSIMLHLRPNLVRLEKAADFAPAPAAGGIGPPAFGTAGFAWQAQDLNPAGACGDARLADAEKGRVLVERAAEALAQAVGDIDRTPLEALRPRP